MFHNSSKFAQFRGRNSTNVDFVIYKMACFVWACGAGNFCASGDN